MEGEAQVAKLSVTAQATSSITPAGREVVFFSEEVFRELRAYAQVPDTFVNSGWNFSDFSNGGGKGGTLMARVGENYIVKELSKGDHKTLLQISRSYAHHVRGGNTLICPIYMHFRDVATGRHFFVMRNSVGKGPFLKLYDLKGCADDKTIELDGQHMKACHKRIWNVGMWCGQGSWSPERKVYFKGKQDARSVKIDVYDEQRSKVLAAIKRDTAWLASHSLMDYSMLIAIKTAPAETSASGRSGPSALGQRPIVTRRDPDGNNVELYVSIIDILQRWTCGKRIARVIKVLEQNKATVPPAVYADRFLRHFEKSFKAVPEPPSPAPQAAALPAVAPPAGDCEVEGLPEERLYSRPMPESRENSRALHL
mmetsp:Transcript_61741/g.133770  ORF Transcript_61741/g.133770 Transcript_61741/m.133770 type:complete len:368 (-) Transcript_61741:111-1214(-)